MTHEENRRHFYQSLTDEYLQGELMAIYHWCTQEIEGWSKPEAYLHNEDEVQNVEEWRAVIDRLKNHEPVQYIFSIAEFVGLRLEVDPRVLIPRPETEELVQLILDAHQESELRVFDIGTGSGCIPLALKNARPNWKIAGCDVSTDALEVAKANAERLKLHVDFHQFDVSDGMGLWPSCDVLVSNPPYIPSDLKNTLDSNVADHEPALALFAPQRDPLYFYRRVLEHAHDHEVGEVWFETHATDMGTFLTMCNDLGFKSQHLPDLAGKPRFVKCWK